MKITRIILKDYKMFKSIDLDFTKTSIDETNSCIVFIGENGSGKTTILELIHKYLTNGDIFEDKFSQDKFELTFAISFSDSQLIKIRSTINYFKEKLSSFQGYDFIPEEEKKLNTLKRKMRDFRDLSRSSIDSVEQNKYARQMRVLENEFDSISENLGLQKQLANIAKFNIELIENEFSQNSDFEFTFKGSGKGNQVIFEDKSIIFYMLALSKNIDSDTGLKPIYSPYNHEIQDFEIGDIVKKLLFSEFTKENNKNKTINELINLLLTNNDQIALKSRVILSADDLSFISYNGKNFDIEYLSSGEKKIVYRLSDIRSQNVTDGIIMVDEPEDSLHPSWQQYILNSFSKIGQNNQIFIATHSPLILSSTKPENIFIFQFSNEDASHSIKITPADELKKYSLGVEVTRILEEIMGVDTRIKAITNKMNIIYRKLKSKDYDDEFNSLLKELTLFLGPNDPFILDVNFELNVK